MTPSAHPPYDLKLLLQTKSDSRRRRAFHTVRCTAARAQYRDERLARIACDRAIGLHGAEGRSRLAFITLVALLAFGAWRALRTLRPLRADLPLCARHTLDALRALWACWTLRARITLRSGIAAAAADHQGHADRENWKDFYHAHTP